MVWRNAGEGSNFKTCSESYWDWKVFPTKNSFHQNVLKDPVIICVYFQSSKETAMRIPYAYQKNQFDFKAGKEIAKNITKCVAIKIPMKI
jgi:hypothetical protein